jgi:ribosome recycling factor
MDQSQILKNCETEMKKTIEKFKDEIKKIHTGRATPLLVEDIQVDYYGSKAPIKQVASINIPEPRMIVIAPWNKDDLVNIQKAVTESDLKVNPQNDGEVVRIVLPALTEERRIEMTKVIGKEKEESRVAVRKIREDVWDQAQEMNRNGDISEDDKFRIKDRLQEIVDRFNGELDEIAKGKEEEIMKL